MSVGCHWTNHSLPRWADPHINTRTYGPRFRSRFGLGGPSGLGFRSSHFVLVILVVFGGSGGFCSQHQNGSDVMISNICSSKPYLLLDLGLGGPGDASSGVIILPHLHWDHRVQVSIILLRGVRHTGGCLQVHRCLQVLQVHPCHQPECIAAQDPHLDPPTCLGPWLLSYKTLPPWVPVPWSVLPFS